MQVPEPLPAAPSLSDFVKKTETNIAKFVEVDEVEESGYKNVVKLDNKTFKDEFRKVSIVFYLCVIIFLNVSYINVFIV